jgi:hypothetical protein
MTRPERACPARRVVLPHCGVRTVRAQPRTAASPRGLRSARRASAARRDCPPGAPHAATRVARLRRVGARAACRAPLRRHHHHVHAPRRAFAARARLVGRADTRQPWSRGLRLRATDRRRPRHTTLVSCARRWRQHPWRRSGESRRLEQRRRVTEGRQRLAATSELVPGGAQPAGPRRRSHGSPVSEPGARMRRARSE